MRLIDADKLKAHYKWWATDENTEYNEWKKTFDTIVDLQQTVTLTAMVDKIAGEICDNYCKFRAEAEAMGDSDEVTDKLMAEHCNECPLSKL